ncbi:MAG: phenylalanine--tRNA ligase subunit beta [Rhodospirillaceae bacterium]|nr:phenylalanine--tRNA ligase subunit beta [Rhodospirillaceae bacterium]
MKFTLSWLKEHLETDASLDEIAEKLTAIGLEVEGVEDKAVDLAPFTIAHVLEVRQHPDADRLRVCVVDTGAEQVQVVCGAPNARTGMKGVFAPAGARIPGTGMDLKKGLIRGQESNGMLCSEREMGLSDNHEGIIELPEDAPLGQPFADYLALNDPVIEIAITPNRQDALGVHGIARDLAAAGMGILKPFDQAVVPGTFDSPKVWKRDLPPNRQDACLFVAGRYFRNVTNRPSPEWLQRRLRAIGLRPISALVDITNLVSYDLARPLHVFDADKLAGDLTMRMARDGEAVLGLDGKDYTLTDDMTVIADDNGVQGIGGLMGGEATGCKPETTSVFLEVALFDTLRTAATGRKLGLNSDARYRFERGVDPESSLWGAEVATRLILDLCGGEASHVFSAGALPDWRRTVTFRPSRLVSLGGVAVPEKEIDRILSIQGYSVENKSDVDGQSTWTISIPSWRVFDVDAHGEADVVEDILRIYGYHRIPAVSVVPDGMPAQTVTPVQRRVRLARRALAVRGMLEAVTWSFMEKGKAKLFGGATRLMTLENPITQDLNVMRPSILPNLIEAAQRNADRGHPDVALFEIGPQFAGNEPDEQRVMATGLRAGDMTGRQWLETPHAVDAFDAKADAMAALESVGAPVGSLRITTDVPAWYHPGRSGTLHLGNRLLAIFGELHPGVLKALAAKGPMTGFELFFDNLPPHKDRSGKSRTMLHPSPFQPVERDFAFVLDRATLVEKVMRAARSADKTLVSDVTVFDVYQGASIGADRKSVAISVTLQPTEKTLTDAEIEAVSEKIVAAVNKQTGGELRA